MFKRKLLASLGIAALCAFTACSGVATVEEKPLTIEGKIEYLKDSFNMGKMPFYVARGTSVESVAINEMAKKVIIKTNKYFAQNYMREDKVRGIKEAIKEILGAQFSQYDVDILISGLPIEEYIPNFYRTDKKDFDKSRLAKKDLKRPLPVVRNESKPFEITNGLNEKNIALWHSHGWYFNHQQNRWMWQRARLFQCIEDLGPMAYAVPYIIPMLENAGANVFVPRERDVNPNEIVIDNDMNDAGYIEKGEGWSKGDGTGFLKGELPYPGNYNPFKHGTHKVITSAEVANAEVDFIPEIPEEGKYAVYIGYNATDNNINDAHYTVFHKGGKTDFRVNQQIGGNTWIYLGHFDFEKGKNPEIGKVVLSNDSNEPGKVVSADVVRFGGGMGVIERNGKVSNRPKYVEGARYYLQYAGMPDTLVYNLNDNKSDYKDDYQSRGEWVDYLIGAPFGPTGNRNAKGLGIPVDLSFAFHTDAGITRNDTVIGSLGIYSTYDMDSSVVFPDGVSRIASRDLTDIMLTEITGAIKAKFDPEWIRRDIWDKMYSEASRPTVPSTLLELLSHQNFIDCMFNLDPRFRFDVSRAIYKSMLKFLSVQYGYDYVVQPLPVDHFKTELNNANGEIALSWTPVADSLEPTAVAKKYVVYTRINDGGFDNGVLVNTNSFVKTDVESGKTYSFKVTAVNEGGESFPSEVLSVCWMNNEKAPVLIVNGFDRICGPASVRTDKFAGVLDFVDAGVPDKYDLHYTGHQYDFNPKSPWTTDDTPGHGASYADYETKVIAGNTFDYPYLHGEAIKANGFSFVSCSDEAVEDKAVDLTQYKMVDYLLGEEKATPWQKAITNEKNGLCFKTFSDNMKTAISDYLTTGGKILVSGSYIATDLFHNVGSTKEDKKFAEEILKYTFQSDHAVRNGNVISENNFMTTSSKVDFNTELNGKLYAVEAPDAINPINGSEVLLRYSENSFNAAIGYKGEYGVVAVAFPIETVIGKENKAELMKAVLKYLEM